MNKNKIIALIVFCSLLASLATYFVSKVHPQNDIDMDWNNSPSKANLDNGIDSEQIKSNVSGIIKKASNAQYEVIKTFTGPSNLVGVVMQPVGGGNKILGWTNQTGEVFMPGPLFDLQGQDLTQSLLIEQAGFISAKELADKIESRVFTYGESGPAMTVFFEPYCGYCSKLIRELIPRIEKGELKVKIIMVGFLTDDSKARAANISNSENKFEALMDWENMENKPSAPKAVATQEEIREIEFNNELMNSAGQTGTPAIMVCDKDSKELKLYQGVPGDLEQLLSSMGSEGHEICS